MGHPLFGLDYVASGFVDKAWRSLVAAGSADQYHDAVAHGDACAQVRADSLVIEGANHLLVIERDARATVAGYATLAELRALSRVVLTRQIVTSLMTRTPTR